MVKKFFVTLIAVMSLATVGVNLQATPASAQKLHQAVPEKYWGNWSYKQTKVVIHPHEVTGPGFHYKGNSLGVHKGKKFVTIFQTTHGKQSSISYVLKKVKHHKKTMLKANFDGTYEYYTRKGIF